MTKDTELNLSTNSSIGLFGNSYQEWPVERIIQEAVKYISHKDTMPRDLKRVLAYYTIIDHFYPPVSDTDLQDAEED